VVNNYLVAATADKIIHIYDIRKTGLVLN